MGQAVSVRYPGPTATEDEVLDWEADRRQSATDDARADVEQACVDCGLVDEWNFLVRHADGTESWLCQEHGQDGLEGDEPA